MKLLSIVATCALVSAVPPALPGEGDFAASGTRVALGPAGWLVGPKGSSVRISFE